MVQALARVSPSPPGWFLAAMGVLLMTNNLTWITQRLTELPLPGLLSPVRL